MATATTLDQAAGQAYANLFPLWSAGTLKAQLFLFTDPLIINPNLFPEETEAYHPISNWCALIQAVAQTMHPNPTPPPFTFGAGVPYPLLNTSANFVYRMCWMSFYSETNLIITNTQALAILAAYNAAF